MPVAVSSTSADVLLSKGMKPDRTLAELKAAGVTVPDNMDESTKVSFFKLDDDMGLYWIGFQNFYVVSRYNPRVFYTKAVLELADAIKLQRQNSAQTGP